MSDSYSSQYPDRISVRLLNIPRSEVPIFAGKIRNRGYFIQKFADAVFQKPSIGIYLYFNKIRQFADFHVGI